jgi:hypothetical protein
MVVRKELTAQPPYVRFIYCNHMIKAISAGAADPSFRHSVRPRRLYARPFGLQSSFLQEGDHFLTERRSKMAYRYGPASGTPYALVERPRRVKKPMRNWVIAGPNGAATLLGMKRSTLQARMQRLGIRVSRAAG